ncbi:Hypp5644 [Branchiostoma lanceolatum]|uniref:Hypp5644 protein n=1 Tax=Branchiostoma lanceolatum TaxID=7740 RepID=A0A8J9VEQ9_BRALA|nr:Hypp5644 [Branchiostoma lanceolatum]
MENRKKIRALIDKFLTSLKGENKDETSTISREELRMTFTEAGNNSLTEKEKKRLFGDAYSVDQLFDQIDADKDGKLTFQEFHQFFSNRGFSWLTKGMEAKRQHVSSLTDYTLKYLDLLGVIGKKVYRKVDDMERSIGVDSDYVKTTDFQLEDEDKMFLFKKLRNSGIELSAIWRRHHRTGRRSGRGEDKGTRRCGDKGVRYRADGDNGTDHSDRAEHPAVRGQGYRVHLAGRGWLEVSVGQRPL